MLGVIGQVEEGGGEGGGKGNREGLELRERRDKGGKEGGTEKKQKMFTETVELGVLVP